MIYPIIYSFLLSFSEYSDGAMTFVGLQNFKDLFADKDFSIALVNVFIFLIVQVPIMLILSTFIATMLNSKLLKWKSLFRMGVFLPVLIDLVTYAIVFTLIFNNDAGILNYILKSLKLPTVNWLSDPLWAKVSVIISITWRWTGYNAIIILAGLQAVDHSIIESAIVDGAGPRTVFFKIIVPMLKPVLLFCAIMSTNGTLQLFTEPFILFPPYGSGPANSTQTVITYLYQNGFQGTAFFTAQEEAGKSWRYVYEWFRKNNVTTNELLVLDTSPYDTRMEADVQQVVLRNRDANAKFKSPVLKQLKNFCHKNGINFSCKDSFIQEKNKIRKEKGLPLLTLGSTELGRIVMESKGTIQGTTLQIPTTGYHTVEETASIKSVKTILHILSSLYIDKNA